MQTVNAGPVDAPKTEVLAEAKSIVKAMIENPRGPYSRIRWYCKDGTVKAPIASACAEHGGGHQHAEYSPERARLAELGYSVGTIFTPLTFLALKNQKPREQRLRELPLERYLTDIDDGWVLRKARAYRGRLQLEDEVLFGQKILIDAVTDSVWTNDNYLLVRELSRVIPHGEDSDLARKVRRAAIDLAERESSAEKWRAEIHSSPDVKTASRLRDWSNTQKNQDVVAMTNALADDLDRLYGDAGRKERLSNQLAMLKTPVASKWGKNITNLLLSSGPDKMVGLCGAFADARTQVFAQASPHDRLKILDVLPSLETEVQLSFANRTENQTRANIIKEARALMHCVYGAGLISAGELTALINTELFKSSAKQLSTADYRFGIAQLKRVPNWAAGNVRYTFAEALVSYNALDSRTVRFSDDLLRGSPLASLGSLIKVLSKDLARLTGSEVNIANEQVGNAIALNPGLARGTLRIYETLEAAEAATPSPTDIVALPETIAELKPIAGILTLGEGNALSHVQLLARNFGIPNVAVDFSTIDLIRPLEGKEVVLAVSWDGNVVLRDATKVKELDFYFPVSNAADSSEKFAVPSPDLSKKTVLALNDIGRHLSGKVIGPKAANLGELNRLFPGKVAPALAIPFGVYADQIEGASLRQRINLIYAAQANGSVTPEQVNAELAQIRDGITNVKVSNELAQSLKLMMAKEFGEPGSYGIFIRSDTNVEDLPQFTGAGLSKTVANVAGLENQINNIPEVWASVLSPRAIAWRSNLLSNPQEIYASVLLMKSVASEKSGVIITSNVVAPEQAGLTVSTAWGVGGAVSGEAAESLVLLPSSESILISEAKTPYRRELLKAGGMGWTPANSGKVLTASDIAQLKELVAEVNKKYQPVFDETGKQRPWDIEFGFVDDQLTLFQIRPLVEKNSRRADVVVNSLITVTDSPDLNKPVDLMSLITSSK